jgi:hypothetical protein
MPAYLAVLQLCPTAPLLVLTKKTNKLQDELTSIVQTGNIAEHTLLFYFRKSSLVQRFRLRHDFFLQSCYTSYGLLPLRV